MNSVTIHQNSSIAGTIFTGPEYAVLAREEDAFAAELASFEASLELLPPTPQRSAWVAGAGAGMYAALVHSGAVDASTARAALLHVHEQCRGSVFQLATATDPPYWLQDLPDFACIVARTPDSLWINATPKARLVLEQRAREQGVKVASCKRPMPLYGAATRSAGKAFSHFLMSRLATIGTLHTPLYLPGAERLCTRGDEIPAAVAHALSLPYDINHLRTTCAQFSDEDATANAPRDTQTLVLSEAAPTIGELSSAPYWAEFWASAGGAIEQLTRSLYEQFAASQAQVRTAQAQQQVLKSWRTSAVGSVVSYDLTGSPVDIGVAIQDSHEVIEVSDADIVVEEEEEFILDTDVDLVFENTAPPAHIEVLSSRTSLIHLTGSSYAMGHAHGSALSLVIAQVLAAYEQFATAAGYCRTLLTNAVDKAAEYLDDDTRDELRGLADGARLPLRHLLAFNLETALFAPTLRGCSNQLVATPDGTVHGQAEFAPRLASGLQLPRLLQIRTPAHGLPHVLPTWPGQVSGFAGMNAAGLAITSHAFFDVLNMNSLPDAGLSHCAMLRHALTHYETSAEAQDYFFNSRRASAFGALLSDASAVPPLLIEYQRQDWQHTPQFVAALESLSHLQTRPLDRTDKRSPQVIALAPTTRCITLLEAPESDVAAPITHRLTPTTFGWPVIAPEPPRESHIWTASQQLWTAPILPPSGQSQRVPPKRLLLVASSQDPLALAARQQVRQQGTQVDLLEIEPLDTFAKRGRQLLESSHDCDVLLIPNATISMHGNWQDNWMHYRRHNVEAIYRLLQQWLKTCAPDKEYSVSALLAADAPGSDESYLSSLLSTLHSEMPTLRICVLRTQHDAPANCIALWNKALASGQNTIALQSHTTWAPYHSSAPSAAFDAATLNAQGCVLIAGGGRGMGAQVALQLARLGVRRFALLGRTQLPADIATWRGQNSGGDHDRARGSVARAVEIDDTLQQLRVLGCEVKYYSLNLGDRFAVATACTMVQNDFGAVAGVIYSAHYQRDRQFIHKGSYDFDLTLAAKVDGALHILSALSKNTSLEFFVGLTSHAGIFGKAEQADAAVANALLPVLLQYYRQQMPNCRVSALSVDDYDAVQNVLPLALVSHDFPALALIASRDQLNEYGATLASGATTREAWTHAA